MKIRNKNKKPVDVALEKLELMCADHLYMWECGTQPYLTSYNLVDLWRCYLALANFVQKNKI